MTKALVVNTTTGEIKETTTEEMGCDTCGHLSCVCGLRKAHEEGCKFRLAATCAVPIECDHGRRLPHL